MPTSRVVVVGASLAGLHAAEALRAEGFDGEVALVGDEPYPPYDRPPLSKQVVAGRGRPDGSSLPVAEGLDVEWQLGVAATGLDREARVVRLADGREVGYDQVLLACGTRARPWPDDDQAALAGVVTVRGRDDAADLESRLAEATGRVLVVGGGFIGCEAASALRERGLDVTLVERGEAPLVGALGGPVGRVATRLQESHGVDLRTGVTVAGLHGDGQGRLRAATLSDGDELDVEVAVIALGAVRNVEWLEGAGLAADGRGITCDASCRVFDASGVVTDDVFTAGDVARWPHPLFDGHLLALEHWGNAVAQARTAAHNMVCDPSERRPHTYLPDFWSNQFGVNVKSVGLPSSADQIAVTQGSLDDGRFVAAYGRRGRLVAAVAFDAPRWLDGYRYLIEQRAPFPPDLQAADGPDPLEVVDAAVPHHTRTSHAPGARTTGPGPSTPEDPDDER